MTSATDQNQQYPLDIGTVIVSGLVTGSRLVASKVSDETIVFEGGESAGVVSFTTDYMGALAIEARQASSAPYYQPWNTQLTPIAGGTVTATALQELD